MELKDIILDYKNRYQLSNKEIAQQFHVTHITVGRWLRGEVKQYKKKPQQNMSLCLVMMCNLFCREPPSL